MVSTVEELSIEKWEEGELVIKQLDKHILTRGAWATVLYYCQEMDPKTQSYKEPHARLVRYRKVGGEYKPQSKFNISNGKQALDIAQALQTWFSEKK